MAKAFVLSMVLEVMKILNLEAVIDGYPVSPKNKFVMSNSSSAKGCTHDLRNNSKVVDRMPLTIPFVLAHVYINKLRLM